jgi:hypothetical protein
MVFDKIKRLFVLPQEKKEEDSQEVEIDKLSIFEKNKDKSLLEMAENIPDGDFKDIILNLTNKAEEIAKDNKEEEELQLKDKQVKELEAKTNELSEGIKKRKQDVAQEKEGRGLWRYPDEKKLGLVAYQKAVEQIEKQRDALRILELEERRPDPKASTSEEIRLKKMMFERGVNYDRMKDELDKLQKELRILGVKKSRYDDLSVGKEKKDEDRLKKLKEENDQQVYSLIHQFLDDFKDIDLYSADRLKILLEVTSYNTSLSDKIIYTIINSLRDDYLEDYFSKLNSEDRKLFFKKIGKESVFENRIIELLASKKNRLTEEEQAEIVEYMLDDYKKTPEDYSSYKTNRWNAFKQELGDLTPKAQTVFLEKLIEKIESLKGDEDVRRYKDESIDFLLKQVMSEEAVDKIVKFEGGLDLINRITNLVGQEEVAKRFFYFTSNLEAEERRGFLKSLFNQRDNKASLYLIEKFFKKERHTNEILDEDDFLAEFHLEEAHVECFSEVSYLLRLKYNDEEFRKRLSRWVSNDRLGSYKLSQYEKSMDIDKKKELAGLLTSEKEKFDFLVNLSKNPIYIENFKDWLKILKVDLDIVAKEKRSEIYINFLNRGDLLRIFDGQGTEEEIFKKLPPEIQKQFILNTNRTSLFAQVDPNIFSKAELEILVYLNRPDEILEHLDQKRREELDLRIIDGDIPYRKKVEILEGNCKKVLLEIVRKGAVDEIEKKDFSRILEKGALPFVLYYWNQLGFTEEQRKEFILYLSENKLANELRMLRSYKEGYVSWLKSDWYKKKGDFSPEERYQLLKDEILFGEEEIGVFEVDGMDSKQTRDLIQLAAQRSSKVKDQNHVWRFYKNYWDKILEKDEKEREAWFKEYFQLFFKISDNINLFEYMAEALLYEPEELKSSFPIREDVSVLEISREIVEMEVQSRLKLFIFKDLLNSENYLEKIEIIKKIINLEYSSQNEDFKDFLIRKSLSSDNVDDYQKIDIQSEIRDFVNTRIVAPESINRWETLENVFQRLKLVSDSTVRAESYLRIAESLAVMPVTERTEVEALERLQRSFSNLYSKEDMTEYERMNWNLLRKQLPFSTDERVREEMRDQAVVVERLNAENLGWVHQAVHNFVRPQTPDYLRALRTYLQKGDADSIQILQDLAFFYTIDSRPSEDFYKAETRQDLQSVLGPELDTLIQLAESYYEIDLSKIFHFLDLAKTFCQFLRGEEAEIASDFLEKVEQFKTITRNLEKDKNYESIVLFLSKIPKFKEDILNFVSKVKNHERLEGIRNLLSLDASLSYTHKVILAEYLNKHLEQFIENDSLDSQKISDLLKVLKGTIICGKSEEEIGDFEKSKELIRKIVEDKGQITSSDIHSLSLLLKVDQKRMDSYWENFSDLAQIEMQQMVKRISRREDNLETILRKLNKTESEIEDIMYIINSDSRKNERITMINKISQEIVAEDLVMFEKASYKYSIEPLLEIFFRNLDQIKESSQKGELETSRLKEKKPITETYNDVLKDKVIEGLDLAPESVRNFLRGLVSKKMPQGMENANRFLGNLFNSFESKADKLCKFVIKGYADSSGERKVVKMKVGKDNFEFYPFSYYSVDGVVIVKNGKIVPNPFEEIKKTFSSKIVPAMMKYLREGD